MTSAHSPHLSLGTMTTNQDLPKFVVWAPDYAGAQEIRLAIRPRHLENAHRLTKEGVIPANAAPADRKFFGSCLIIEAESLEAVRKIVEGDVYYKEGVWDKEKLQILPMLLATSSAACPF
ncbi:hypothetical protein EV363DRAFT_1321221 [Boletus edulis]|nr:hypothetical protein EV363DRAFT_1321221 [Boletus edulis]